jgi:hypothetical protein
LQVIHIKEKGSGAICGEFLILKIGQNELLGRIPCSFGIDKKLVLRGVSE